MQEIENPLIATNDGLETPTVGSWGEKKYKIIFDYNPIFSTGMKKFWDQRVYIDLYAGAGKAKIRNTNKILYTSPLLALKVRDKFDKYIFCDIKKKNIEALKRRVDIEFNQKNVSYFVGDCNEIINDIINEIPAHSKEKTLLSFCFVDPFSLNIKFETIKRLSEKYMDFLVLLAFGLDGKRNINLYIRDNNKRIDDFLGLSDWRERWDIAKIRGANLVEFLAKEFTSQMVKLNYLKEAINNFIPIHSDKKNLPLYYLSFYSRNKRGYDFWNKVKTRNISPSLFDQ